MLTFSQAECRACFARESERRHAISMFDKRPLDIARYRTVEVDRNPMSLVHVKTGADSSITVTKLYRIIGIDFQIVEIPPARQIEQAKDFATNLKRQRVGTERATLGGMWQRQAKSADFLDVHISCKE